MDEVLSALLFPAGSGTIAFGHAAGWTNATESAYANTHAWAGGEEDPLRPPRCRQPGVLRRHARLMNPRHVRVLLFAPRRDDVARTVGTEALRRLAFVAGGTGGRGSGAPTMWAPTWYGGARPRTLAWTAPHERSSPPVRPPPPWLLDMRFWPVASSDMVPTGECTE